MLEELESILVSSEKTQISEELKRLLATTQQKVLQARMETLITKIQP
jgi:hypothetical protein